LKVNHENAGKKVAFTKKQLAKAKSPGKKTRREKRLDKEERKLAYWHGYIQSGTIPKAVFGTKNCSSM